MVNFRTTVVLVCGLLSVPVFANESYLCITDQVTGFARDKLRGEWRRVDFPPDAKYIVSTAPAEVLRYRPDAKWEVKELGFNGWVSLCTDGFNEIGNLFCRGPIEFKMNKQRLRFIATYNAGYTEDDENTPHIAIGRCSPL